MYPMWTIDAGAMDRSADFVQLLSQFVQQIEGEWTPDLEHGPTRPFASDLRPLRKTYRARSRRLKYTCGPKGSTGQLPRKRPPSNPAAAQDRIYTPDGLGRVLKHRRGGLPIVNR